MLTNHLTGIHILTWIDEELRLASVEISSADINRSVWASNSSKDDSLPVASTVGN